MKPLSQSMQAESDNNRKQPATSSAVPFVEPIEPWDAENDETAGRSLVHPPNPVMLDGIEKKRFCRSLANRCLMFLVRVGQTLTVKPRSLFGRPRGSSK